MSAGFSFNRDRAMRADEGGVVTRGGIYIGVITKMVAFKKESGSGGMELTLETIHGQKCNFVQIYTQNRDGTENTGKSKIDSALGILGIDFLPAVLNADGEFEFPAICKKRIAFAVQKEEYLKSDGSGKGFKFNLLHFFFPDTMQTFREHTDGSPASTSKIPIEDILLDQKEPSQAAGATSGPSETYDDLPF